ncbi:MAG: hypothetical protein R3276_10575 [Marinobacter sp.]|nr:hypothetical protein [Marinobacter sp.]
MTPKRWKIAAAFLVMALTGAEPVPEAVRPGDTDIAEPSRPTPTFNSIPIPNPNPHPIEERAQQRQEQERQWMQSRKCGREQSAVQLGQRSGLSGGCMIQQRQQFRGSP